MSTQDTYGFRSGQAFTSTIVDGARYVVRTHGNGQLVAFYESDTMARQQVTLRELRESVDGGWAEREQAQA